MTLKWKVDYVSFDLILGHFLWCTFQTSFIILLYCAKLLGECLGPLKKDPKKAQLKREPKKKKKVLERTNPANRPASARPIASAAQCCAHVGARPWTCMREQWPKPKHPLSNAFQPLKIHCVRGLLSPRELVCSPCAQFVQSDASPLV